MLFNATIWQPEDNENKGFYRTLLATVSQQTYDSLLSEKPPDYIELIIDDGEVLLLKRDDLSQLHQIKEVIPVSR